MQIFQFQCTLWSKTFQLDVSLFLSQNSFDCNLLCVPVKVPQRVGKVNDEGLVTVNESVQVPVELGWFNSTVWKSSLIWVISITRNTTLHLIYQINWAILLWSKSRLRVDWEPTESRLRADWEPTESRLRADWEPTESQQLKLFPNVSKHLFSFYTPTFPSTL